MSFIRDLYFFIRLFVLLLFVLQRLDAECHYGKPFEVEETFHKIFNNELQNPFMKELLELLDAQDELLALLEGVQDIPETFKEDMQELEELFKKVMLNINELNSYIVIKAKNNQLMLYRRSGYFEGSLHEKTDNLVERLNEYMLFEQFKKLNLENTNGEGSSSQNLTLDNLCNYISYHCFYKWEQFDDNSDSSFFQIKFNMFIEGIKIQQLTRHVPLLTCSSKSDQFFITTFKSNENKIIFVLRKNKWIKVILELIAFVEVDWS